MIIYPKEPTPKLGRKSFETTDVQAAIAAYRKRFAPLADNVELIAEGTTDGSNDRQVDTGVVGRDGGTDDTGSDGEGVG